MAAVLTGIVRSMREVEGITQEGPRKGQAWRFLSIEISDPRYGHVWSCQLRDDDKQFTDLAGSDLVEHQVKVTVKSQSASERSSDETATARRGRPGVTIRREESGRPPDDSARSAGFPGPLRRTGAQPEGSVCGIGIPKAD